MRSYWKFDAEAFMSDYRENLKEARKLQAEYDAIATEGGFDYSSERVTHSNISHEVENKAIRREKLGRRLIAYKDYLSNAGKAIKNASDDDRFILMLYVKQEKNKIKAIQNHFDCNQTKAFRMKEEAMNKVREQVTCNVQ